MISSRLIIILVWGMMVLTLDALADCRGCCSHHSGVVCSTENITMCGDGTPLSSKCEAKGCNKCFGKPAPKTTSTELSSPKYDRKLFTHWIDVDRDCQDTRAEILIKFNIGDLKFKGSKECVVKSGKWVDPYSGQTFTQANDLDVDHIVPLKFSYEAGANSWSNEKRQEFANDEENLLPVGKRFNRAKGAKGPSQWLPPDSKFKCVYVRSWERVIKKYNLSEAKREIASVEDVLSTCDMAQ